MLKKILYGLGGFIVFIIILAIIVPTPDTPAEQVQENTDQVTETLTTNTEKTEQVADVEKEANTEQTVQTKPETTPEPTQTSATTETYYPVIGVVDGDTIKISMNGTTETLRLIGIDTPETVDPRKPVQCFGTEASNKAKELLSGRKVRIESDSTQDTRDKYGRLLVYVYRDDGLFFNKHMIEEGYAYEYTYQIPYQYQTEFKSAETSARTSQRGLWSPNTCNGDPNTGTETEQTTPPPVTTSSGGKFYTSSHHTAKYWYPESCDGWKDLSPTYLKSFNTLEELLAQYSRTKNPNCE